MRRPLIAVAACALALTACSGGAPEILTTEFRLALVSDPDLNESYESLRVFVAVRDPDGADDPAFLVVAHTDSDLRWELSREEWTQLDYAGDTWYGSADLRGPSGSPLPRGRYSVAVEDQALTRVTTDAFLTAPEAPEDPEFPLLAGDRSSLSVSFPDPVVLRVYTRAGQLRVNEVVRPGPLPEAILSRLPDESGLLVFLESTTSNPVLIGGPFRLAD